ncbi:MAG: hypothetical protein GX660_08730 [Clostridiaceae bacterium]|nr:hypothetical protein [Clostridiaceae bacterium]
MFKNYSKADLEKLNSLFKKLLLIIESEGDSETKYATGVLKNIVVVVEDVLKTPVIADLNEIFSEIMERYKSLYPPRGGLTEFFIWREDFDERVKANKPLDDIKEDIKSIIGV